MNRRAFHLSLVAGLTALFARKVSRANDKTVQLSDPREIVTRLAVEFERGGLGHTVTKYLWEGDPFFYVEDIVAVMGGDGFKAEVLKNGCVIFMCGRWYCNVPVRNRADIGKIVQFGKISKAASTQTDDEQRHSVQVALRGLWPDRYFEV